MNSQHTLKKWVIPFVLASVTLWVFAAGCQQSPPRTYRVNAPDSQPDVNAADASFNSQRPHNTSSHNRFAGHTMPFNNNPSVHTTSPAAEHNDNLRDMDDYVAGTYHQPVPLDEAILPRRNENEYHIGPGDVLEVSVYELLELEKEAVLDVPVDREGNIFLPLLKQVSVAGMTCSQLRTELIQRLGQNYLRDPRVDVNVKTYGSKQVLVLGLVQHPGEVTLPADSVTLIDVLGMVGGIRNDAAPTIEILRGAYNPAKDISSDAAWSQGHYGRELIPVSQVFAEQGQHVNPVIYPGDVIKVPSGREGYIYVSGEVKRPGTRPFHRPMNVLQAVTAAGDLTNIAAGEKCKIVRLQPDGREKIIEADLYDIQQGKENNIVLARNDMIVIPVDPVKKFFDDIDKIFQRAVHVGVGMDYDIGPDVGVPAENAGGGGSYY